MSFVKQNFFCFTGSGIHMNAMRATLYKNCHVKILVLESESENGKQISGSESESEKKSFGFTTLPVC
jgi:hypothetical protein